MTDKKASLESKRCPIQTSMEKSPPPSSSSSSSTKNKKLKESKTSMTGFGSINDDLVQNILKRLPALSFASAACVSKLWNRICNRILSKPKFASAISINRSEKIALQEVVDKVLGEPIRPHFAIANIVSDVYCLENILHFLAEKLGSKTPIILTSARGIMGRDALTDEFKEVVSGEPWFSVDDGIVLTVGFVPGLKVDAIPLLPPEKAPRVVMIESFVMDIRDYATSASGCTSPVAIIMFGDGRVDQKCIIEKLDYAMSMETIIVGDERAQFLYRSGVESRNVHGSKMHSSDAVALVFARDRDNCHGIGKIQFHAALSNGVSPIGPRYKAVSVRVTGSSDATLLSARREGEQEILDGERILNDINVELENHIESPDLYIGCTKRRKHVIGSEKSRLMTFLDYHWISGGDHEYLLADGVGINTGDYFQFYHPDPGTALSSCSSVYQNLRNLKLDQSSRNCLQARDVAYNVGNKEIVGGFIFSCWGRADSFFESSNVDSSPFLDNFPGIPLAGIFCGGEIARGLSIANAHEGQEESTAHCCLHVYSSVYLVVSYTPAPLEH